MKELLYPSLDLPIPSLAPLPPAEARLMEQRQTMMEQRRYIEQLETAVMVMGGFLFLIWLISRFSPRGT